LRPRSRGGARLLVGRTGLRYPADMRKVLVTLLVFACAAASAEVYKRIGPDGSVQFSDRPGPDAEKVDVGPIQTLKLPPVRPGKSTRGPQQRQAFQYTEFSIVSPANEEGIRANDGNVTVRMALQPALRPGDTVAVTVDGERIGTGGSTTIQLTNLPRGGHTIQAAVIDTEGKELVQAQPVTFYVLRAAAGG
jgi:hypothetical protein